MNYADFESILVPENNRKQNPNEFFTDKYKKHIAFDYGYKLAYVDDKFSKPFKLHLGEDGAYSFINRVIEESKYCSEVMKKHFNKELVMTKEDNENFQNSSKCWICDNSYVDGDNKERDYVMSHVTGLVMLLENIKAQRIEIVISMLKFLLYSTT